MDDKTPTDDKPSWNFFEDILPPEVTVGVFSFLSLEDVVYVSLVCKSWSTYFATKNIWKQIYEQHFGALDPKSVDLSQQLRWKRFFVQGRNLQRQNWQAKFAAATQAFTCTTPRVVQEDVVANRYHVIVADACIAVVDLKSAAKIIPVKSNPVTLHNPGLSDVNQTNTQMAGFIDTKIPKDMTQFIPQFSHANCNLACSTGTGDYLFRDNIGPNFATWNAVTHGAQNSTSGRQILSLAPGVTGCVWKMNSKYAAYINLGLKAGDATIIDLAERCSHCSVATLKNYNYVPETFQRPCEGKRILCAGINVAGPFEWLFASQLNPNVFIFATYNRMVLWKKTHSTLYFGSPETTVIKLADTHKFMNLSEHTPDLQLCKDAIDSLLMPREWSHWFSYTTHDMDDNTMKTHFVDLNKLEHKVSMPALSQYAWVPKRNKVACAMTNKVIVYDLEKKSWASKIILPTEVKALTFSKSGAVLLIATYSDVFAYQWETSRLIGSCAHNNRWVKALHFVMDQVLIIVSDLKTDYKKIMIKLDF